MGIDEFPSPVPPLDDDPFASLSSADIMTTKAIDDDASGSKSQYEEEEGEEDNKDYNE
jgi:hypothetical protein